MGCPHVAITMGCPRVATTRGLALQALSKKVFSRYYAEVLFRHFDADNSNTRRPPVQRLAASGREGLG